MFKQVADVQTADTLALPTPKVHLRNVAVQPSPVQRELVAGLAERAEAVRAGSVPAEKDNMLLHHQRRPQDSPRPTPRRPRAARLRGQQGERLLRERAAHMARRRRGKAHPARVLRPLHPEGRRAALQRVRRSAPQARGARRARGRGGVHPRHRHRGEEARPLREGERRSRAHPHRVHAEDGRGHQRAAQARRHPRPRLPVAPRRPPAAPRAHRAPGQHECRGGGVPLRHRRHLRRVPLPARRGKAAIHSAGHDLEVARSHSRRR